MSLVTIEAQLPNLDDVVRAASDAGDGKGLQFTSQAVRASLNLIQRTWIAYASGAEVAYSGGTFKIDVVSGAYIRSLEHAPRFLGDLSGEVFSDSPYGHIIEDGFPAFDMKAKMLKSPKAKIGKDGKRYITVAFRHGVPGTTTMPAMPENVYAKAKYMKYSRRNDGLTNNTRTYTWGGRFKGDATGQRSHIQPHPGAGYTWKTGLYQGMVKMGQPGHAQYLTFRRISENSATGSWMHPGVKPRPIRQAVKENTEEDILRLIREGFEMDLYFMGLGGE